MFSAIAITAVLLLAYCYAGYPVLMALMAKLAPRKWKQDPSFEPTVAVILPAYNEELVLERCLTSLFEQDYPASKLQIVVGSDCSSDGTNEILRRLATQHPTLLPLYFTDRRGKIPVLIDATKATQAEVLVYIDADVMLPKNFVRCHVRNYASEEVGAVSGELAFKLSEASSVYDTESTYWSWETSLRRNEALLHSTVGLYGGNYSMRRSLWKEPAEQVLSDDFFVVLTVLNSGKRLVVDPGARCLELYGRTARDEFKRKTRNAASGLSALIFLRKLLLPTAGRAAFMLWPHKVLRWATPLLLLALLFSSVAQSIVAPTLWSNVVLASGVAFLVVALTGWMLDSRKIVLPVFRQAFWVLAMNAAFVYGVAKYFLRIEKRTWVPVSRVVEPPIPQQEVRGA